MYTKLIRTNELSIAAEIIKKGGLVAIPTETVYGLAANAFNENAVKKIFMAKGRPADNPLIVHVSDFSEVGQLVESIPLTAQRLAQHFWPGALTMIMKRSDKISDIVSAGLNTVAVRMPDSEIARKIISLSGVPLAAPSANLSGAPSPTTAQHVIDDLEGEIEGIVLGDDCRIGIESTVIDLTGETPFLLRPGGVSVEEIEAAIGEISMSPAVLHMLTKSSEAKSPGMKYNHYAPDAEVIVVDSRSKHFTSYVNDSADSKTAAICFEEDAPFINENAFSYGEKNDHKTQAHMIFSLLREIDNKGFKRVYIHAPSRDGVGLAVYNRIIRAASFNVIRLPLLIGITGTTGSGKSEASELISKKHTVIDADKCAGIVVDSLLPELSAAFGIEVVGLDGKLDRELLAKKAFANPEKTALLNAITHPPIIEYVNRKLDETWNSGKYIVFLNAPQLFEAGYNNKCSKIIAIIADDKIRLKRIMSRDKISRHQATLRMNAQKSNDFFSRNCDIIIENNGTVEAFRKAIREALHGMQLKIEN